MCGKFVGRFLIIRAAMQEESEKLCSLNKKIQHPMDIIIISFFIQFLFLAISRWLVTFLHIEYTHLPTQILIISLSLLAAYFRRLHLSDVNLKKTQNFNDDGWERERKELLISTKMNICMDMRLWLNFILFFVLLMEMGGGRKKFFSSELSESSHVH